MKLITFMPHCRYNPNFANATFDTHPCANGDGITFTRQFNTPLVGDGVLGLISSNDDLYQLMQCNFMVDKNGKRFANESLNTYLLLDALQNLANGEAYVIADQNYYENNQEVDYKIEAGTVTKYETLNEVITATGINKEELLQTIESYNACVDSNINPEFDLDVTMAHKITDGPYYVEQAGTYCFGTLRGIKTNAHLSVLNGDEDIIEGLYGAGELVVGNVFNGQYSKSGGMISYGINSGTLAAKEIISNLIKK